MLLISASELMAFAENAGDWQAGNLKLGVIPTIAPFLFEGLIEQSKQGLPRLNLQLQEDTTENLLRQLNDGELDLLVLALPMETPGCKQLVLGHDPFHLVTHKDWAGNLPSPIDVSALPKQSVFLLHQEHCMTGHAVSACGLKHQEQVNSLAASSLFTLVELVKSGMGLTFLPELAISKEILGHQDLISLPAESGAFREIGLVWRNGTTRMRLFRQFAQLLAPLMPVNTLDK